MGAVVGRRGWDGDGEWGRSCGEGQQRTFQTARCLFPTRICLCSLLRALEQFVWPWSFCFSEANEMMQMDFNLQCRRERHDSACGNGGFSAAGPPPTHMRLHFPRPDFIFSSYPKTLLKCDLEEYVTLPRAGIASESIRSFITPEFCRPLYSAPLAPRLDRRSLTSKHCCAVSSIAAYVMPRSVYKYIKHPTSAHVLG